jgi:hypothetical protein
VRIPLLVKGINILDESASHAAEILKSDESCISNPEIPKSQIGLPEPPCQLSRVQFKVFGISGFEMQDSSDFHFPLSRLPDSSSMLLPLQRRGGCGINQKSRSLRSAADGVARSASPIGRSLKKSSERYSGLNVPAELTTPSAPLWNGTIF